MARAPARSGFRSAAPYALLIGFALIYMAEILVEAATR